MTSSVARDEMRHAIAACGYFPDLVEDGALRALGDEELRAQMVHYEATFSSDEVNRHLTVLMLTPTRLVICHTDEAPDQDGRRRVNQAVSTSESIPLAAINAVALSRVVSHAEVYAPDATGEMGGVAEAWLTIGWGTMTRLDLEPASCPDPTCDADHGYTGTVVRDDLTVRVSAAGDGPERVAQLVAFTTAVQHATGRA